MPESIITKHCCCCKKSKGLDEFRRNKTGRLGRDSQCKTCKSVYAKTEQSKELARARNQRYTQSANGKAKRKALAQSPKAKQSMQRYLDSPHGRAMKRKRQATTRERVKQWFQTEKGKACRKEYDKRHAEKYPDKIKARLAMSHAIESGRLPSAKTRYCKHCGNQAEFWHHYLGYEPEHWLDVIALCRNCDFVAHSS